MFNTPILDVAIGLIFVFLLYSLLATSINEALATGLSLRARMLRKAIAQKMLSNTVQENKILDFFKGILEFFKEFIYIFKGPPEKKGSEKNIGDQFYTHPIIKNYGSSSFFKIPSYLAASNFTIILIETLKEDFNYKLNEIAFQKVTDNKTLPQVIDELNNSSDIIKIKELLDYYAWYYATQGKDIYEALPSVPRGLDKEVHCILQLYLRNSLFDFNEFSRKIEGWYNDTMDRVSGWYKRQTQFILFVLGFIMAFIFNIDTIGITNRLSTDKDARDQMVQLAIQSADLYKNDPRVQRQAQNTTDTLSQNALLKLSQEKLDEAKKTLDSSLKNPNMVLGLGWDKYGADNPAFITKLSTKTFHKFLVFGKINLSESLKHIKDSIYKIYSAKKPAIITQVQKADTITTAGNDTIKKQPTAVPPVTVTAKKDSVNKDSLVLAEFYKQTGKLYPARVKTRYVFYTTGTKKILGFLITAFAIGLGAPFWFDLLNKLVKLRGAGKKDDSSNTVDLTPTKGSLTTIINTGAQNTSGEAVG